MLMGSLRESYSLHSTVRFLFGKQKRMTFTPLERQSIRFKKMGLSRVKAKMVDVRRARGAAATCFRNNQIFRSRILDVKVGFTTQTFHDHDLTIQSAIGGCMKMFRTYTENQRCSDIDTNV